MKANMSNLFSAISFIENDCFKMTWVMKAVIFPYTHNHVTSQILNWESCKRLYKNVSVYLNS